MEIQHMEQTDLTTLYKYADCKQILQSPSACIPQPSENGLNETALLLRSNFARTANPPALEQARMAAMELFNSMKPVNVPEMLDYLIGHPKEMDWVSTVCKNLPVLYLLKSFGFSENACRFFLQHIEALTKIMLPQKTPYQLHAINSIAEEVYDLIENQLLFLPIRQTLPVYVSNLAGLLIQSYDACRGLLSNSLLQALNYDSIAMKNKSSITDVVMETLRYDPPVRNTRRILCEDVMLGNRQLPRGRTILIDLAAANRDPMLFDEPHIFNPQRKNNHQHLTFGAGLHACLANSWAVNMATETLFYLFSKFTRITLTEEFICYEPVVNLRLPCSLRLSLL